MHHHIIFILAIIVLASGLFIMMTSDHYVRKIIGLSIFQSAVLIFYIALGKTTDGVVPLDVCHDLVTTSTCHYQFSSPVPQVLMLTAIVVGFANTAVALALIYQIKKAYNTVSESEIAQLTAIDHSTKHNTK